MGHAEGTSPWRIRSRTPLTKPGESAEQSELLHIPFKPLRLLWLAALVAVILAILHELRRVLRRA